jgi:hypothetical protein
MNRKPDVRVAAHLLSKAFAAQGSNLSHQAALNLVATLEGYESYAHLKADQTSAPAKVCEPEPCSVHLLFGSDEVAALQEAQSSDDDDEMADALNAAKTFSFASPELRNAFMDGVEEAAGWLDYVNVTDDVVARPAAS